MEGADVEVTIQVPGPDETVGAGEPVCLEPGQYEFTAEVVNEDELAAAIGPAIDDLTFDEGDLLIEEFEDTFVVEECPDNNGDTIDIDDRDQTNVCNNVVNLFTRDVQNPNVDVNNEQAVSGPVSGDVSNEQAVDIAQELNISPVIVQQCIQQNAGRDAIIGDDDNNGSDNNDDDGNANNDDDGGDTGDTGVKGSGTNTTEDCIIVEEGATTPPVATSTESASATASATGSANQECTIIDTAPDKKLPFTGGWSTIYYSIVAGFVLVGASLLGTGFGVWRARQR